MAHRLDVLGLFDNEYREDGFRTCSVTGLEVHRSVDNHVKLFGLTAVVALLYGGIFAFTVAMTRWEVIGLLDPGAFYTHLSLHAWNLLIFWMVFMEIAILYVGGPMVLGRRLPFTRVAKAGWLVMAAGAVLVNYAIWTTEAPNEAPLLTAYVPMPIAPLFYAGAIVFILGTVVAALPFFATMWFEKRENPGKTLPLVSFAAFVTSIIAVEALVGGLLAFGPALLWRLEIIEWWDAAWYRQMYWIIGHGTQQINLVAMIAVWYFLTHVVAGAEVASEKVSRTAFILYLFFINLGAAHHLLSDPAVSTGWRIWNTSYAFYGATFASLIHAFAIPAGLEAGRRKRGKGGGLFGWLTSAPWSNPVFSSTIFSIILFGFLGGITGVMMGQLQLNMTWHNTFATVGHFHGTVVLGTTVAFMGLVFFVIRTMFMRQYISERLASIQPYFYSAAMGVAVLMMMYVGILYGIPRRTAEVVENIPGTEFSLSAAAPLFAVFGIFALLAITGGVLFVLVAVGSLVFGDRVENAADNADLVADGGLGMAQDPDDPVHAYEMRGTFVLCLVFLAAFVITYLLNWYLLTQLWSIGA
ncbi:cytochrome c oxidase subunit I [Natrinema altunense]|uniref:Cytochrome c oxidase subunit I n=1 Tax=Natrinema altunense (strain JCM 12890 / CGMCC 1.3731 / AJ2) TaxID=1227494 RepID=L9ZTK7_NATA2|nr:cbb3-type cytochrome c oxidase subunit I [Natrinema altunense]ELY88493.1 cytochrome c oxidase subunit I [Natrinema altunense JCM 12890]